MSGCCRLLSPVTQPPKPAGVVLSSFQSLGCDLTGTIRLQHHHSEPPAFRPVSLSSSAALVRYHGNDRQHWPQLPWGSALTQPTPHGLVNLSQREHGWVRAPKTALRLLTKYPSTQSSPAACERYLAPVLQRSQGSDQRLHCYGDPDSCLCSHAASCSEKFHASSILYRIREKPGPQPPFPHHLSLSPRLTLLTHPKNKGGERRGKPKRH